MNYSKMALTLFVGCALSSLVACGDDSSSASSSGAQCKVSKTATTVKVDASYMGQTYTSVATMVSDERIEFHSVYGYPTQAEADEACADEKEESSYWNDGGYKVSCSGLNVTVDEFSEMISGASEEMVVIEDGFNRMCQKLQDRIDRGEI